MMVEVKNLTKKFGDAIVLDDVSCRFETGELTCILGENGAGKTTLLKAICGMIPFDFGDIFLDGQSVSQNPDCAKSNCAYVPENPTFIENLSVAEHLQSLAALFPCKDKEFLQKIVKNFALESVQKKRISTLSKGYRQRLAFAQAALKNAKILALDEPTSGLDPEQLADFRAKISSVKGNATVIVSTHLARELESICDDVVIMRRGKVVALGKVNDILCQTGCADLESAYLHLSRNIGND